MPWDTTVPGTQRIYLALFGLDGSQHVVGKHLAQHPHSPPWAGLTKRDTSAGALPGLTSPLPTAVHLQWVAQDRAHQAVPAGTA